MTDMIIEAFARYPEEGAIVGRLVSGYGEIEFALALCADRAIRKFNPGQIPHSADERHIAIKALYRIKSESSRLQVADALMRDSYVRLDLEDLYADSIGAIRYCLKIRNQYAHCHWRLQLPPKPPGLVFTDLEDAAAKAADFNFQFDWHEVNLDLLKQQEAYFIYARQALMFTWGEFRVRVGMARSHRESKPTRALQPRPYILREEPGHPIPGSVP